MTPLKLKSDWLWADVGTPAGWKRSPEAPKELAAREITRWAKERHQEALQARYDELDALLVPGAKLAVRATEDELALRIDDHEALCLYDRPHTSFLAAQWRHHLSEVNVTKAFDAKKLVRLLLDLRETADAPLRERIVALDARIEALSTEIESRERELNEVIYRLYALNDEERALVEAG